MTFYKNTISYKDKTYELHSPPGSIFGDIMKYLKAEKLVLVRRPKERLDLHMKIYEASDIKAVFKEDIPEDEFAKRVDEYNKQRLLHN